MSALSQHIACICLAVFFAMQAQADSQAPVSVVQRFIEQLRQETSAEQFGQNRHGELESLTPRLQRLVRIAECDVARATAEEPAPYAQTDASLVFDRWDLPTQCTSQALSEQAKKASVKVRCEWDGSTDHQAGQWMEMRFDLALLHGTWRIDEALHLQQNDGDSDDTTLSQRLIAAGQQSSDPSACQRQP